MLLTLFGNLVIIIAFTNWANVLVGSIVRHIQKDNEGKSYIDNATAYGLLIEAPHTLLDIDSINSSLESKS